MKWATLLKDIKEKVGLAQSSDAATADPFPVDLTAPPSSSSSPSFTYAAPSLHDFNSSPSRYSSFLPSFLTTSLLVVLDLVCGFRCCALLLLVRVLLTLLLCLFWGPEFRLFSCFSLRLLLK